MNAHYVNWLEIIVCLLLYHADCRPSAKFTKTSESPRHADYQYDLENFMHPNEFLSRNKRMDDVSVMNHDETSTFFWQNRAQYTLRNHLAKEHNENIAKNVIFFLGDGMSIPTLTAARIYLGQMQGHNGEESHLSFETFPYIGLAKTYCIDKQVPDSACTATAYLCGVKGNFQTIGVNGRVQVDDCSAANDTANHVHSLLALAQRAGKSTGIVTTTTVTHASPAGTFAHSSNRKFECDSDVIRSGLDPNACQDIASQLILNKPGNKINVIFGGGRTKFLPKSMSDVDGNEGERDDDQNLIGEWKKDKDNAAYINDKDGLDNLDVDGIDYVLGLFASYHMDYNFEADRTKQPTLLEMTEKAIKILQKNPNGYFLFVEGGRIDHGHHAAQAIKALDETVQFSNAIKLAVEMTNREDTLIVVTSDHAHTISISGYPDRGNPIVGLNNYLSDVDNLPTMTLSYANGPGYGMIHNDDGTRKNLTGTIFDSNFTYPSTFPSRQESHGGDDVAVFTLGCMSHLFSGVYEQSAIPHFISYASCLGGGLSACNQFD